LQPQNKYGYLIGHVKRFDDIRSNELDRGYQSAIGSSFHTDSTDYVGLMCFGEAKSGGNSLLASAVTIYNHILTERPDLIGPLMSAYSKTRYGEERPGDSLLQVQGLRLRRQLFQLHRGQQNFP
jgi:hypothetical protein